jgi:glycosyltransferase involved in cell wall biosynthesis
MSEAVSVCIPAWQAQAWIAEAIESALAQPEPPIEIIVADDGSSDATAEVAERFGPPVRVARLEHRGIGAARNACAGLARGELIAFLDADDRFTATSLDARLRLLRARPEIEVVFGGVRLFCETYDGEPVGLGELRPAQVPAAMLVRRASIERVGPFREDMNVATDLEWLLRARELPVREATIEEQVVWRRIHGANHSLVNERARASEFAHALKESLDRRRAATRGVNGVPEASAGPAIS